MSLDCVNKSTNIISIIKYVLKSSCLCNTYLFLFLKCQMFFNDLPICQFT
uniref:Uncharacterized protein n=1 Tax=Rhinopithecus roxellana TaxID=61622 RepID=A0A2K6RJT8_RHIRO